MRRADYLVLAAILRETVHAARGGEVRSDRPSTNPEVRRIESIGRKFAVRAHLGGLTPAAFLEACDITP